MKGRRLSDEMKMKGARIGECTRSAIEPATIMRAMSQENIAAVEGAYRAFAEGGLDRFIEHWTDDLDHRSIEGAPDDRGPIHGKAALRAYIQEWMDLFDDFR